MVSLVKKYSDEKIFGRIYTPEFIVQKILNDVNYNNQNILNKKILDPSCGDGRFLQEIVKTIIKFSSLDELENNLMCVYGWDIDENAIDLCKSNLNGLIKEYNLNINWNIYVNNSLTVLKKKNLFEINKTIKFDYIVGNPPYIRIQHLDSETREFLKQNSSFCKQGSTDIYIAFYEICFQLLKDNGICGIITPNSFLYTETAKSMRDFFIKYINQITNYAAVQLFDNASTYNAITIFQKTETNCFLYQEAKDKTTFSQKVLDKKEFENKNIWQLNIDKNIETIGKKLGDICQISVGITTLSDKLYIFEIENIDDKFIYILSKIKGKVKIEKAILKPVIKASVLKSGNDEIKEYIIFPYEKINNKHKIIKESDLKEKYPLTYDYLLSVKDELDKRDGGKENKVYWYAFGRSQGLDTSFGKKILFSPINLKPNFILSQNEEATFYSGYSIKYNGNYEELLNKLNSKEMEDFISVSSRDFRGGWKGYNKKILENFVVNL